MAIQDDSAPLTGFLAYLESPPPDSGPIGTAARSSFMPSLDASFNLFRQCANEGKGWDSFAQRFLISSSHENLLVGFHLLLHGYFAQASSLLRSVPDGLRIANLLVEKPEMGKLWVDGGKENWHRLNKAAKKVKENHDWKTDDLVSGFSEAGAHPTFVSNMPATKMESKAPGSIDVNLKIGGARGDAFIFGVAKGTVQCFRLLHMTLSTMGKALRPSISEEQRRAVACDSLGRMLTFGNQVRLDPKLAESFPQEMIDRISHSIQALKPPTV